MADICERAPTSRPIADTGGVDSRGADPLWFIEALFLTYRDFVSEPDRILAEIGFGRAHHRVLYFVDRYPGMRVADLLEILQITKQSLARVLRELIKEGYIRRRSGEIDRRERRLYPTERGRALATRLTELQSDKMRKALAAIGAEGTAAVAAFFQHMAPDAAQPVGVRQSRQAPDANGQARTGQARRGQTAGGEG
jgi:DNA-binding MarR family transcriptional regulator